MLNVTTDSIEKMFQQAGACWAAGRLREAESLCMRLLSVYPQHVKALCMMGDIAVRAGAYERAEALVRQAIAFEPGAVDAYNILGNALRPMERMTEAVESFRRALELAGRHAAASMNMGGTLRDLGRIEEAIAVLREALEKGPADPVAHSQLLLTLHYLDPVDASGVFAEHLEWEKAYARPLYEGVPRHVNERRADKRLRIGYVSSDFCFHPAAYFFENLLTLHDRREVDVFCYADAVWTDSVTERLKGLGHTWRDITGRGDEEVAEIIRQDRIDILVDLGGHTGSRLLVFARKPAPVQATYLGYPNTTGMTAMDYCITDGFADPVGMTERFHSEKLFRLDGGFLCYRADDAAPAVAALPMLTSGVVTFGSFNYLAKVSPTVVGLWARILQAVEGSRMLVKCVGLDAAAREHVLNLFAKEGVSGERIELRGRIASRAEHLRLYERVDIALDTFPYHGTTTTCEALWMGVPVVSLGGKTHVSRVGVSILSAAGLGGFVAGTPEEYERIAVELTRDAALLSDLRSSLREHVGASALMDGRGSARGVEAAYREMWGRWCGGDEG